MLTATQPRRAWFVPTGLTRQQAHTATEVAMHVWLVGMTMMQLRPTAQRLHVLYVRQARSSQPQARLPAWCVQLAPIRAVLAPRHALRAAPDDMWTPPAAIKPRTASPVWRAHTRRVAAMWQRRTAPSVRWGASHSRRGGHLLATATTVHTVSIRVRQARLRALRARRDASRRHRHRCRHAACVRRDSTRAALGRTTASTARWDRSRQRLVLRRVRTVRWASSRPLSARRRV
jgi:hypothetical protein